MSKTWLAMILLTLSASCKKIVEVEDPAPLEIVFCSVGDELKGQWITDSVWVITEVDTLDSLIENRSPGVFYEMSVECGEKKEFLLTYTGFHNITTVDVRSSNYETVGNAIFAYDPFSASQDTAEAGFRMPFQFLNDTLVNCTLRQDLGRNQRSAYYLFFRAV